MKAKLVILYLVAFVLSLHGTGVINVAHKIIHHSDNSINHCETSSCATSHPLGSPIDSTPDPEDAPSDQEPCDDDQGCDFCVLLKSITPTSETPAILPVFADSVSVLAAMPTLTSPTQRVLLDQAARAPPKC